MTLIKYGSFRKTSTILSDQAKNLKSKKNLSQTLEILNLVKPMIESIKNLDIKAIGNFFLKTGIIKNNYRTLFQVRT